ncbi:glycine zipper 2TM domain-containing protein [Nitratifractor sp.]
MKKILILSMSAGFALFGKSLHWQESVPVVKTVPIYRMVTIRTPYEECYTRRMPVVYNNGMDVPVASLIGAAAGGVIGHQFGRGHGKEAATIGGAVVGALFGSNLAEQNRRVVTRKRRICETHYREHRERRLVRYKNIAWYRGQKIVKWSREPLRRIRLSITASY